MLRTEEVFLSFFVSFCLCLELVFGAQEKFVWALASERARCGGTAWCSRRLIVGEVFSIRVIGGTDSFNITTERKQLHFTT
jgi:hypothetical protein